MKIPFINTLLGFTLYWEHKPANRIHADSSGYYTSQKNSNISTKK